jgi:hypothetical protein
VIFCFTAVAILSISSSDKDKCGITEDCSISLCSGVYKGHSRK